jgi:preprotein translocase SecE subunit
MAVAVKNPNPAPTKPTSPQLQLALASWGGVLYVLGGLLALFYALPIFWQKSVGQVMDSFAAGTLLLLAMVAAGFGLIVLGARMAGPHPVKGLRGGVFLGTVALFAVAFVTWCIGNILETYLPILHGPTGQFATLAAGAALLALTVKFSWLPVVGRWAVAIEDQGWFSTSVYKKSQGLKVRRSTMGGILVLGGTGVYSLLSHGLGSRSGNWVLSLPFTGGPGVTVVPDAQYTVPLFLTALTLWGAFRVINFPTFADFLIATEAELNKVSWTTGRRLMQDTLVVLTTLVLFTFFLFFVDVFWGWFLTTIGILRTATTGAAAPDSHW